ncbi:MAG: 50S ribosomal protein L21 [Candidatus Palauibacterales bacterium]|nr:50S ribosomal protein L21 [Candidatus Palauibacterales bacterium]
MYAIFRAKGKQFRAEPDKTIRIPSLDAEPGDTVTFDEILLAEENGDVHVGRPTLHGGAVSAEVVEHGKGDKIIVFKRKKRKNYRRKYGHRQPYTEIRVVDIDLGEPGEAGPAPETAEEVAPEEAPEPTAAEEAGEEAEEAAADEVDITDAAEELADEHGIDVATIDGTGKGGRVLKSDVQDAVDAQEADEAEEEDEAEPVRAEEEQGLAAEDVDITDAARELADEHGIDITTIDGTGKDGRVLKSDVQDAVDAQAGSEE